MLGRAGVSWDERWDWREAASVGEEKRMMARPRDLPETGSVAMRREVMDGVESAEKHRVSMWASEAHHDRLERARTLMGGKGEGGEGRGRRAGGAQEAKGWGGRARGGGGGGRGRGGGMRRNTGVDTCT